MLFKWVVGTVALQRVSAFVQTSVFAVSEGLKLNNSGDGEILHAKKPAVCNLLFLEKDNLFLFVLFS